MSENTSVAEPLPKRGGRVFNVKYMGMLKLIALYAVTLGLLYAAFWLGYYRLKSGWGIGVAVALVAVTSILLAIFKKRLWSAILSCLSVSAGIGLSISTFFVMGKIEPSRFFGLVLLMVLAYKSLQSFATAKFRRKGLITGLIIVAEIAAAVVFFAKSGSNMGLNSQIAFAFVVAVFLSFGQLSLYKYGANDMWRTIALSYIIGFVVIVIFIVVLIISMISEDGSAFEIFAHLTIGDVGGGAGTSKRKRRDRRLLG